MAVYVNQLTNAAKDCTILRTWKKLVLLIFSWPRVGVQNSCLGTTNQHVGLLLQITNMLFVVAAVLYKSGLQLIIIVINLGFIFLINCSVYKNKKVEKWQFHRAQGEICVNNKLKTIDLQ